MYLLLSFHSKSGESAIHVEGALSGVSGIRLSNKEKLPVKSGKGKCLKTRIFKGPKYDDKGVLRYRGLLDSGEKTTICRCYEKLE